MAHKDSIITVPDIEDGNLHRCISTIVEQLNILLGHTDAPGHLDLLSLNTALNNSTGKFIPEITDLADFATGITHIYQVGTYTKLGNLCYFQLEAKLSSKGTLSPGDTIQIKGLPFKAKTISNQPVEVGDVFNISVTAGISVAAAVQQSSNRINLLTKGYTFGTGGLFAVDITNDTYFSIAGSYQILE